MFSCRDTRARLILNRFGKSERHFKNMGLAPTVCVHVCAFECVRACCRTGEQRETAPSCSRSSPPPARSLSAAAAEDDDDASGSAQPPVATPPVESKPATSAALGRRQPASGPSSTERDTVPLWKGKLLCGWAGGGGGEEEEGGVSGFSVSGRSAALLPVWEFFSHSSLRSEEPARAESLDTRRCSTRQDERTISLRCRRVQP
jgi:hypothetical protein